jgi:hypothetical protein
MANVPSLNQAEPGRFLRHKGHELCVVSVTANRESESYLERQWVLRGGSAGESYLVKTEEKTSSGLKETWVLTRQIDMDDVAFEPSPGEGQRFNQDSMPAEPPAKVKYREDYFKLEGATKVNAADDEGDIVPKITWDYFSTDRKRNLAIEIWKEPDKDYPETYLGDVVSPGEIQVLDKKETPSPAGAFSGSLGLEQAKAGGIGFLVFGFMAMSQGLSFDYYTAIAVPIGMAVVGFNDSRARGIMPLALLIWGGVAAAAWFGGFRLSFWYLSSGCVALAALLPRLFGAGAFARRLSLYGVLPALWLYSFIEYVFYAPGPRAFYQYATAFLLPAAAAGVSYALNSLLEGNDA